MTRKQLERFVKTRNKSPFNSNLQFQIDAEECGFSITEIGEHFRKIAEGHYEWDTPHGVLEEKYGRMSLRENAPVSQAS